MLVATGAAYPEVFRGAAAREFVRLVEDESQGRRARLHFPLDESKQVPELTRAQQAHLMQIQQRLNKKSSD